MLKAEKPKTGNNWEKAAPPYFTFYILQCCPGGRNCKQRIVERAGSTLQKNREEKENCGRGEGRRGAIALRARRSNYYYERAAARLENNTDENERERERE